MSESSIDKETSNKHIHKQLLTLTVLGLFLGVLTSCGRCALSKEMELQAGNYAICIGQRRVVKEFSIRRDGKHTVKLSERELLKDSAGNPVRGGWRYGVYRVDSTGQYILVDRF